MNKVIIFAAMLVAPLVAQAQHSVTIKGHVKFIDKNFTVQVFRYQGTSRNVLAEAPVDSVTHRYEVTVPFSEPGSAVVDCGRWQSVNVWLEDENLDIDFRGLDTARIKIKNPPYVYIKGGKNNELMNLINFEGYRNYQSMIAYSQAAYRAPIADNKAKSELSGKLYDYNYDNSRAWTRYFVSHYADRNSVLVPISQLNYDDNKGLVDSALASLRQAGPASAALVDNYIAEREKKKAQRERVAIGAQAPDFAFQTPKGKKQSLSKYKGKVLVLDFWASWCGPCRAETPNLKKIYADMKGKGVEFLSVSIDAKRPAWLKAMGEDQASWPQGWTTDAGKGVMETYQFSGIPFILVIDKDGTIYRKNVRGEGVREAINDALSGKPAQAPKAVKAVGMAGMM